MLVIHSYHHPSRPQSDLAACPVCGTAYPNSLSIFSILSKWSEMSAKEADCWGPAQSPWIRITAGVLANLYFNQLLTDMHKSSKPWLEFPREHTPGSGWLPWRLFLVLLHWQTFKTFFCGNGHSLSPVVLLLRSWISFVPSLYLFLIMRLWVSWVAQFRLTARINSSTQQHN